MIGTTEVLGTIRRYASCTCGAIVFDGDRHKCGASRVKRQSDEIAIKAEAKKKQRGLFEDATSGQLEGSAMEHAGRDGMADEPSDEETGRLPWDS